MNLKLKAGLYTTGFIAATIAAAVVTTYVFQSMSADHIKTLFIVGIAGFFVNLIYQITLSRMEYDEKVNRLSADIDKSANT